MKPHTHTAYVTVKLNLHGTTNEEAISITDAIKARAVDACVPKHWSVPGIVPRVVIDWEVHRRIQKIRK